MSNAKVYAKQNMARISPKKMGAMMNLVRGKTLHEAKLILAFDQTKAASMLFKLLKSAEANAINNNNLNVEDLYVSEVFADGARVFKWGRPGSKGRFNPIIKRNSHLTVGLSVKENKVVSSPKKSGRKDIEEK